MLTPINASRPPTRGEGSRFGPWGLSFATDRWDLRRAVVIEGRYKGHTGGTQVARFVLYVDAQTANPLYYMSFDSRDERIDVGMFVGRWSEDAATTAAGPASEAADPRDRFGRRIVRQHRGGRRLAARIVDDGLDSARREDAEARALGQQPRRKQH